jgi:hypothetical protein
LRDQARANTGGVRTILLRLADGGQCEGRPEIRAEIDEQGEEFVEFVRS